MQVHYTFKHMDATDAIKSHAVECLGKLDKFVGASFNANWVFIVEAGVHRAELHVKGPHVDCFVEGRSENLYHSMDEAVNKMEKQLKKQKEILKDHLHRDR